MWSWELEHLRKRIVCKVLFRCFRGVIKISQFVLKLSLARRDRWMDIYSPFNLSCHPEHLYTALPYNVSTSVFKKFVVKCCSFPTKFTLNSSAHSTYAIFF